MVLFLLYVFRPIFDVFLRKDQETLKVGKIRSYDEERVFCRRKKNGFNFLQLLKRLLHKNWEGEKDVGGSCVLFSIRLEVIVEIVKSGDPNLLSLGRWLIR